MPERTWGGEIMGAWVMAPCWRSSKVISPPAIESDDPLAPHCGSAPGHAPVSYAPGFFETFCIAPPHLATGPAGAHSNAQNSHSLSVLGCQTTRCLSVPFAGCALGGIGTSRHAACNGFSRLSGLFRVNL